MKLDLRSLPENLFALFRMHSKGGRIRGMEVRISCARIRRFHTGFHRKRWRI